MLESEKTRKIFVLATGAAVALSATAIVLLKQHPGPNGRLTATQSALQQGANNAKDTSKASDWLRMACRVGSTCND